MSAESDPGLRLVTLADIARLVGDLSYFWISGAAAGLTVALAIGFLMTPIYRASVVVMPVSTKELGRGALGGLLSGIGGDMGLGLGLGGNSQRDEALAVLKSQQFARRLIADENLLPVFFADRWDPVNGKWSESDPDRIPTDWDAWKFFDRKVRTVFDDRDRGLVTIRIEWSDPELAARWANLMVARANDELRSRKLHQLEASLEFLKVELGNTQLMELRTAISKVMESQINERMLASARPEYAFQVIDPAVQPDMDQPERPKKLLMSAVGLAAGALLGLVWGIFVSYARQRSGPSPA